MTIKRYSKLTVGGMAVDALGDWCKYSDVEQLEQERDQLAARVEQAEARIRDMLEGDDGQAWKEAEKFLELPKNTSLAAHDRELLLRLADEELGWYNRPIREWLREKAEELENEA